VRLRRDPTSFVIWLVFVLGVIAVFVAILTVAIWLGNVQAAERVKCAVPDPRAAPIVKLSSGEIRALAALAWAEARGEADPYCSMQAVAAVVVNRLRTDPSYYGATVTQVIHRPYAFSAFGRADPNRAKMARIDESDGLYVTALLASIAALSGADPVAGATHFYAGRAPSWSRRMVVTVRIGAHTFARVP
jgi:spore germination cell wall hydrolase CwlJ-like protein